MRWTVGILAGGRSRRMGQDKARLSYGDGTLLSHMLRRFPGSVLLSVAGQEDYADILETMPEVTCCPDRIPDCGPLGGLYSLLCSCPEEALFVCPVDVPLLPERLPERLAEAMRPEEDALWLSDETGRVHPLCGLYRKRICAEVEAQILAVCLRVMELEKHIRVRALPAGELGISDMELLNCNVPERYELACSLAQKKSGKPEGKEDERWTRRKT